MATRIKRPDLVAVSAYDRAASWVISLNILVGVSVGLMFLIWLGQTIEFEGEQSDVILVENIAGRGDHAAGMARDIEAPGIEELQEETEPQVEQLLESVTEVVSTQAAALDTMQTSVFSSRTGDGLGDSRPPGPLGEGKEDVIPRGERWAIVYISNSMEAYAQQLDFFRIELGAIGGGEKQVDYARNFRQGRPDARSGPGGDSEQRLYMLWTSGALKKFDQQLLRRAGVKTTGRIIVQFYPPDVENQLARIEMEHARRNGKTDVRQIKKTTFGVRRKGAGFEYYVEAQRYRAVTL
jgi:hypothetical protein